MIKKSLTISHLLFVHVNGMNAVMESSINNSHYKSGKEPFELPNLYLLKQPNTHSKAGKGQRWLTALVSISLFASKHNLDCHEDTRAARWSISVTLNRCGASASPQNFVNAEWFMKCFCLLKELILMHSIKRANHKSSQSKVSQKNIGHEMLFERVYTNKMSPSETRQHN